MVFIRYFKLGFFSIEIMGMTALGPGLLSGISLAANAKGSKVIICTDGCANVGIGSLPDDERSETQISNTQQAYRSFGDYARKHGFVFVFN